jgi:hypothetical protein
MILLAALLITFLLSVLASSMLSVEREALEQHRIRLAAVQATAAAWSATEVARAALEADIDETADGLADPWAEVMVDTTFWRSRGMWITTPIHGGTALGVVDEARKLPLTRALVQSLDDLLEVPHEVARLALLDTVASPFELCAQAGTSFDVASTVLGHTTRHERRVNVNTSPSSVLEAVGLLPSTASAILTFRVGPDQRAGSNDDRLFSSPASIADSLLNVRPLTAHELSNLTTLTDAGRLATSSTVFACRMNGTDPSERAVVTADVFFARTAEGVVIVDWIEP